MKRIASIILTWLGVVACASPMSLRQGPPVLDEMTVVVPERVAGCIGDKLEAQNTSLTRVRYSTRPTSTGYSIAGDQTSYTIGGASDTIILVDITKVDSKTHVQMYTHFPFGDGPPIYFTIVRGCL